MTGGSRRPDWALAVVIGAGGLGMAVARRLGLAHRLLLADRDAGHLERQVAGLVHDGYDAQGLCCDVTAAADIGRLIACAVGQGPIATLTNVVGLSPGMGDFRTLMAVNLVAPATIAQAFREVMSPGGSGVFIASSAAHMAPPAPALLPILDEPLAGDLIPRLEAMLGEAAVPATAYTLSKAALIRLCARQAAGWGARGARIVSLSPGLIATPQGAAEFRRSASKHALLAATPLGREGTMLEIAGVVEFLHSDRASFLSGIDILVDGGLVAALNAGRGYAPDEVHAAR